MRRKNRFLACSAVSSCFLVNLWTRRVSPKGPVWKLIGKHITLTKPKILKISETNETVLRKFTNPLCLKASLSSWTARSGVWSYHESSSSPSQVRVTSQVRVKLNFPFFFSSFVFNCCVKIMYQRYEDSKILLFFLFVYFSLPITTVYSCINLVRSCFSKK